MAGGMQTTRCGANVVVNPVITRRRSTSELQYLRRCEINDMNMLAIPLLLEMGEFEEENFEY